MEKLRILYNLGTNFLTKGSDVSLLLIRLFLVYVFYEPAIMKVNNFSYIAEIWFVELGIPFPTLNAYLATSVEVAGVILLTLGFLTRFISLPLIGTMLVAIITVHGTNGLAMVKELSDVHYVFYEGALQFETSYQYLNGYENALIYSLMLFVLVTKGSGKFSLDYLLFKK